MSYRHRRNKSKLSQREIPAIYSQQADVSTYTDGTTSPKLSTTPQDADDMSGRIKTNQASDVDNATYENLPVGNLDGNAVYTEVDKNLKKKNRPSGVDRCNKWTDPKQNGSESMEKGTQGGEVEEQYELAKPLCGVGGDMEEGEATEMIENPYYDGLG